MLVNILPNEVSLKLTALDTESWAIKTGNKWPRSTLRGKSLCVDYSATGIVDLLIDGTFQDCDGRELNAIVYDHLIGPLSENHPVRKFLEANQ